MSLNSENHKVLSEKNDSDQSKNNITQIKPIFFKQPSEIRSQVQAKGSFDTTTEHHCTCCPNSKIGPTALTMPYTPSTLNRGKSLNHNTNGQYITVVDFNNPDFDYSLLDQP